MAIAVTLNEVIYRSCKRGDLQYVLYRPYFDCTLPICSLVHNAVPFPVNLIIYIVGFSEAAYAILLVAVGIGAFLKKNTVKERGIP